MGLIECNAKWPTTNDSDNRCSPYPALSVLVICVSSLCPLSIGHQSSAFLEPNGCLFVCVCVFAIDASYRVSHHHWPLLGLTLSEVNWLAWLCGSARSSPLLVWCIEIRECKVLLHQVPGHRLSMIQQQSTRPVASTLIVLLLAQCPKWHISCLSCQEQKHSQLSHRALRLSPAYWRVFFTYLFPSLHQCVMQS